MNRRGKNEAAPVTKRWGPVAVIGTGISHPKTKIKVADLEPELKNFDRERAKISFGEFAAKYMGAESIYVDDEDYGASHYMVEAAQRSLECSGVTPDDIGSIYLVTCTGHDPITGIRGSIVKGLGIEKKHIVEISEACTGFMTALGAASDRAQVRGELVLVIGGDTFKSTFVDSGDFRSSALFGDAAAAAVVGPCDEGFGIKESCTITQPEWTADACEGPDGYFAMDATGLKERIPAVFAEQFIHGVRRNGFDPQTTIALPHQVNGRLLEVLSHNLEVEYGTPPDHIINVFHKYGNTVAASIGIALHHAFCDGYLKRGTNAVMLGAGAGFNYGYLVFTADRALTGPSQTTASRSSTLAQVH